MQISAASPSPNFHSRNSHVKKISAYILAICANFPCKIETFELEVVGVEQDFAFCAAIKMSHRETTLKRLTNISFLSLICFKIYFTFVSNNIY